MGGHEAADAFGAAVERALADDSRMVAEGMADAARRERPGEGERPGDDSLARLVFGWAVEDALGE